MIYLWTIPENYKNKEIGDYNRDISPDRFLLRQGRNLSYNEFQTTPTVQFQTQKEKLLKYDSLPNNSLIPLVNHRIKAILETIAPNDVQFFKASLSCKNGELEGYYFLNATHSILGIDHEKSQYTKAEMAGMSWISSIHYLTYKPNCMEKHELARDEEYKGHLLVSEKIKQIFDKEKITGVWLVKPEDYYQGPITAEDLINEAKALEDEEKEDDN